VVLQGVRAEKGMGSFANDLKPDDSRAVREYLISRANVLKGAAPGVGALPQPRAAGAHEEN
jgi:hypothetical protein